MKGHCERCYKETTTTTMSKFNTQMVCVSGEDSCIEKERAHPQYKAASDREMEEVRNGNYNFEGVGKPNDL